jgi:acetyl esterase/lipase
MVGRAQRERVYPRGRTMRWMDEAVVVLLGPTVRVDLDTVRDAAVLAELGVVGEVVATPDVGGLSEALGRALATPGVVPVVVAGAEEVAQLIDPARGDPARGDAGRVVWYDLAATDLDDAELGPAELERIEALPAGTFLRGRGLDGLVWAVRRAVYLRRWPVRRHSYGSDPDQVGELRLPAPSASPAPVAVLLHGGFWRSIWALDLMDALATDLLGRGFATWNVEYRRPDQHDWQDTVDDVAAAIGVLPKLAADAPLDIDRTILIGHSAGAQLALQAAPSSVAARIVLAVSLAGVLDLVEADRRWLSSGATAAALGGRADDIPQVYAASSPLAQVPLGVPQLIVVGTGDSLDFVDMSRRYAEAAAAAGDDVTLIERPGDHFDVIDPRSPIWQATAAHLRTALTGRTLSGDSGGSAPLILTARDSRSYGEVHGRRS